MHYTVYKTTNLINGKIYIGKHQTKNLEDRYLGSGKRLGRALKKHGVENFQKEILFVFDNEDDMNKKEAELVTEEFCLRDDTYNICPGGRGGFGYINREGLRSGFEKHEYGSKHRQGSIRGAASYVKRLKEDLEFKRQMSTSRSKVMKEFFEKNGHHWSGRSHNELTKQKIGSSNSISQAGSKNSQFGTMWITDGVKNIKIKKDQPVPDGWSKGRK